ncbi:MAG: DUF1330 domain-containing protein [Betaproteobacteria bacterium]|nr:DUF1330 domain-containing protein [Betaproteobacteria bacterium]
MRRRAASSSSTTTTREGLLHVIANAEVADPVAFGEYLKAAPASVAAPGGALVTRGDAVEALEGDWAPTR